MYDICPGLFFPCVSFFGEASNALKRHQNLNTFSFWVTPPTIAKIICSVQDFMSSR
jgi:hypothetical protein